jgi:predicted transglutaminase-like cysteine proteinase
MHRFLRVGFLGLGVVAAAMGGPAKAGLFGSSEYARDGADSSGRWSAMLTRRVGDPCGATPVQTSPLPVGHVAPSTGTSSQPSMCRGAGGIEALKGELRGAGELPLLERVERVNSVVNRLPYVADRDNYAAEDYWASLPEFAARGGDCEDYAIAKYMLLKSLGVPSDMMRIAVVHDLDLDTPHAVLSVAVDGRAYILDNQASSVRPDSDIEHYRPVFSINEAGWWLHMPN